MIEHDFGTDDTAPPSEHAPNGRGPGNEHTPASPLHVVPPHGRFRDGYAHDRIDTLGGVLADASKTAERADTRSRTLEKGFADFGAEYRADKRLLFEHILALKVAVEAWGARPWVWNVFGAFWFFAIAVLLLVALHFLPRMGLVL